MLLFLVCVLLFCQMCLCVFVLCACFVLCGFFLFCFFALFVGCFGGEGWGGGVRG